MIERYEMIDREEGSKAENDQYLGIRRMCILLLVSSSGYYNWQSREVSETRKLQDSMTVLVLSLIHI